MQKVWRLMHLINRMQKHDEEVEVDHKVEEVGSR
jgi:hypothetical protein